MLNQIDSVLQTVTPTVMVPRHQELEPLARNGHRFLAASDGLWIEARRSWLYLRWPLVAQAAVAMPYGSIKPVLEIKHAPRSLVDEFVEIAKIKCPLECAAWIVWNSASDKWKLVELETTTVRTDFVAFSRPRLSEDEHLVVDLHSHGRIPAFFSSTDDEDDRGEFKVSGVIGNLDGAMEAQFRLCANGLYVGLGNQVEVNHG